MYTREQKQTMLQYPIEGILSQLGYNVAHNKNNLYFSPFRTERTPSFKIYQNTNTWHDFGDDIVMSDGRKARGVLDLLMLLCRFTSKDEAFDWLAAHCGKYDFTQSGDIRTHSKTDEPKVRVSSLRTVTSRKLKDYIEARGLEVSLVRRYCSEADVHIAGFRYPAVSLVFPNNAGGYVYRNRVLKGCSSSDITTIDSGGCFSVSPVSRSVLVVEGFINFLSYLRLISRELPDCDVCVLNSVSNVDRALPYLRTHSVVNVCTDNDKAGDVAFGKILSGCDGCSVYDRRDCYKEVNDINDYLMSILSGLSGEVVGQS